MDDATATDNCGDVTITVEEETTPGACAGDYVITRTFTATDDCGNATSATQTITIIDTTAPVITLPEDYEVECELDLVYEEATATDLCSAVVSVQLTSTDQIVVSEEEGTYLLHRTFTCLLYTSPSPRDS